MVWIGKNWPLQAPYIVLVCVHGNSRKSDFLVNRFVPENFQRENFSGLLPTESLRTQDLENIVSLDDLASVSKL